MSTEAEDTRTFSMAHTFPILPHFLTLTLPLLFLTASLSSPPPQNIHARVHTLSLLHSHPPTLPLPLSNSHTSTLHTPHSYTPLSHTVLGLYTTHKAFSYRAVPSLPQYTVCCIAHPARRTSRTVGYRTSDHCAIAPLRASSCPARPQTPSLSLCFAL